MTAREDLFAVYVHWPFCAAKCPYCDFNSHVRDKIDESAWRVAYEREIAYYAALTPGRKVTSVFFGGGTPSLMHPDTVASVIAAIRKGWPTVNDIEITLEANPTSVEAGKFKDFRDAGVNRVSVGVQALNDNDLKFLGRQHSAAEALKAVETAAAVFDRFSFDLIYARPGQTWATWQPELMRALSYGADHLSLYQLTIEEGTPFHLWHARGDFTIPDNDSAGTMYEETNDAMAAAGLPAYEVSNYARPGQESRHNLTYWRYGDYVGIGPGAHGRLTIEGRKVGTRGHRAPEIWLERVGRDGHGTHPFDEISADQIFVESLMMGLRLREGVWLPSDWRNRIDAKKIEALADEGLIVLDGGTLRPTAAGLQRVNGIVSYLL